ncbi:MAG TPA: hypothetical protein VGI74_11070 [Streptosporangiaceae bacterium]
MKRNRESDKQPPEPRKKLKEYDSSMEILEETGNESDDEGYGSQHFSGMGYESQHSDSEVPGSPGSEYVSESQDFEVPSLTEGQMTKLYEVLQQLRGAMVEITEDILSRADEYTDTLQGKDERAIGIALETPQRIGSVTTSQTPPGGVDFGKKKTEEERLGEVLAEKDMEEEPEEAREVEVDEDAGIYIEQTAEGILSEVLKGFLDDVIKEAKGTSPEYDAYPSGLLRLEIMDNPRAKSLLDGMRDELLDGLKAEIWSLLQQEEMVEE